MPGAVLVMEMARVSATVKVVGVKVTVILQVAPGARVVQFELDANCGVLAVGVPIWRVMAPVFERVMVCWVAVVPGRLLKMREVGLSARPESGEPKPVSAAVRVMESVWMVRVPVAGPVVEGV